jgi:hypothetical protein
MELAKDGEPGGSPERVPDHQRHLRPADQSETDLTAGGGDGHGGAETIVDALKSSAEQELTIAERIASKARQAFALGAGVFVVAQTVAFGNFDANKISTRDQHWIIVLAIVAVVILALAAAAALKADSTVASGDLPLDALAKDLNAAYEGDEDVVGRLGGYYLGVVRTRRAANVTRVAWYKQARWAVLFSLVATTAELIFAHVARAT